MCYKIDMNKKTIIIIVIVLLAITALVVYAGKKENGPGKYDTFATCVKDSGAKFFGAFWCPHCQDQKKMFESSAKLLPYIECSTPNGQSQLDICINEGIKGYPTWRFSDGEEFTQVLTLEEIAEKTSCTLPQ